MLDLDKLATLSPLTLSLILAIIVAACVLFIMRWVVLRKYPNLSPTNKVATYYSETGRGLEVLAAQIKAQVDADVTARAQASEERREMLKALGALAPLAELAAVGEDGIQRIRRPTMELTEEIRAVRRLLERQGERWEDCRRICSATRAER